MHNALIALCTPPAPESIIAMSLTAAGCTLLCLGFMVWNEGAFLQGRHLQAWSAHELQ